MSVILSFGLFSDAHYAKDLVYGNRYCNESLSKLQACVAVFHQRRLPFAVNLGDLIDHRGEDAFDVQVAGQVLSVFGEFTGERHSVIGNHDVSCLSKQTLLAQFGSNRGANYSFDHSGFHFVVLDSNCHEDGADYTPERMPDNWADAWVSQTQLEWLTEDLASVNGRRTVVFCHANVDYHEWNGDLDPHVIRNHAEVRSVLENAGNVVGVIMGHYHHGRHGVVHGILYVTMPGICEGTGPENNAFGIASLHSDGKLTVEGFGRIAGRWIA